MRTQLFLALVLGVAGCDDTVHSSFYDLGSLSFKHIGDPCHPDVPPKSECGFAPQFYCSSGGVCASACNP